MILVTGASGLLGSNLLLTGAKVGLPMGAVIRHHQLRLPGIPHWQLDLTDTPAVRRMVADANPGVIFHCAAQTNLDAAENDPAAAERINVEATRVLARAAAEVGARFVYVSTDAVFDGRCSMKDEDDAVRPLSVYGRTKYDGEIASTIENREVLILRTNIYGWNAQSKHSLAEWMLDKFETKEQFAGFTDVHFCPMLVNDLVDVVLSMLTLRLKGLYHVCGSERVSKYDFAISIANTFGFNHETVNPALYSESALIAQRALDLSMSTRRVSSALGRQMPSVEQGLRRFAALRTNGFYSELKSIFGDS